MDQKPPSKKIQTEQNPPRIRKGGHIKPNTLPLNADGYPQCRWCSSSVKPPRRTFCSTNCVHEHRTRTDTRYMRTCVYKRDNAICNICKQDTKKIARLAKEYKCAKNWKQYYELLQINSIPPKRKLWLRGFGGGFWDADHIVAVKDGGGDCSLNNIRTLCIQCHKKNTSEQRKKWAKD